MYNTNIEFLATVQVPVSSLKTGHVALDIDVFPMDIHAAKKKVSQEPTKATMGMR